MTPDDNTTAGHPDAKPYDQTQFPRRRLVVERRRCLKAIAYWFVQTNEAAARGDDGGAQKALHQLDYQLRKATTLVRPRPDPAA